MQVDSSNTSVDISADTSVNGSVDTSVDNSVNASEEITVDPEFLEAFAEYEAAPENQPRNDKLPTAFPAPKLITEAEKFELYKYPPELRSRIRYADSLAEKTGVLYGASEETIKEAIELGNALGREVEFFSNDNTKIAGVFKDGTIKINVKAKKAAFKIFAHELTHSLKVVGNDSYQKLKAHVFSVLTSEGKSREDAIKEKKAEYSAIQKLTDELAEDEIVASFCADRLFTDAESIKALTKTDRTLAQRMRYLIDRLLAKLGNKNANERAILEKARRLYESALAKSNDRDLSGGTVTSAAAEVRRVEGNDPYLKILASQLANGEITEAQFAEEYEDYVATDKRISGARAKLIAAESDRPRTLADMAEDFETEDGEENVQYSISYTSKNKPVVVINDDITRNAKSDKALVSAVKAAITKFESVPIKGQTIHFISDTKKEFTYSKYTKYIRKNESQKYNDKMRIGQHPQDIIYATTDYINEKPNHPRKDNIIDFARGSLLVDVSGRQYTAEVVIGFTKKGICELHDIVNMNTTTFEYKKDAIPKAFDLNNKSARSGITSSDNSISQNSDLSTQNAKKDFGNSKNGGGQFDYTPSSDETAAVAENEERAEMGALETPETKAVDKEKVILSGKTKTAVLKRFGITEIGDYVQVQKKVYNTLQKEGFFTSEDGRSRIETNEELGIDIEINKDGIKETFNFDNYIKTSKNLKVLKIATIDKIPDIIKNCTLITDPQKNYHNANSNLKYLYLLGETEIDGQPIDIKITVRQSVQKNKFYVHNIDLKKNSTDGSPAGISMNSKTGYITDGTDGIISQNSDLSSDISEKATVQAENSKKKLTFPSFNDIINGYFIFVRFIIYVRSYYMPRIFNNFNHTMRASYIGYVVQAIVNNFIPLLFIEFSRAYSITLDKISLLITINFGVQLLVDLLSSKFVDKIGYRAAVLLANGMAALGLTLLSVLPSVMPNAYVGILLSVVFSAIGGGLLEVVISPVVEACPCDRKEAHMSLLHSFYCWGHMAVVLISTVFFFFFGIENWKYISLLFALIPFLNTFYFMFVPINSLCESTEKLSVRKMFSNSSFKLFVLLMACAGAAELSASQWASAFAEGGLGIEKTLGDLLGPLSFALMMGISRVYYAKVSEKISLENYMISSIILCVASYLLISLCPIKALSFLGFALCGFSVGILWPGTYSLAAKKIKGGGTAMFAFLALAGDLGCTTGPTIVGFISENFDNNLKIGILAATIFPVIMLLGVSFLKKSKRE